MVAEDPEIAGPRGRIARPLRDGHRRHGAPGATFFTVVFRHVGQQLVQLAVGEADQRQVEILGQQIVQFRRQQKFIPLRPVRRLVGQQAERLDLRLRQFVRENDGHGVETEKARRLQPQMAIDH